MSNLEQLTPNLCWFCGIPVNLDWVKPPTVLFHASPGKGTDVPSAPSRLALAPTDRDSSGCWNQASR